MLLNYWIYLESLNHIQRVKIAQKLCRLGCDLRYNYKQVVDETYHRYSNNFCDGFFNFYERELLVAHCILNSCNSLTFITLLENL